MYKGKKIAVVVPAHNEERFIAGVIKTVPDYVDRIYVVNDASTDKTSPIALKLAKQDSRISVLNRKTRGGVGGAIITGHRESIRDDMQVVAVMAGDGQMDPAILENFIDPIVANSADYVKGNRLSSVADRKSMPIFRLMGNYLLTVLTRAASGYWNITDPQDGYTAIDVSVLKKLDLDRIENGFAFENDMLVKLNVLDARITDVSHPSVYHHNNSKIRYASFIFDTGWVLVKDSVWRIWAKHVRKNRRRSGSGYRTLHEERLVKGPDTNSGRQR